MATSPSKESKGGWLSDETLERERRQFNYGMRNQYITKDPPLDQGKKMRGVYSVTKPAQFLTRAEARFFGKESQPEDYQAGKPKADTLTKLIQPKKNLDEKKNVRTNDQQNTSEVQPQFNARDDTNYEFTDSWKHEFQAGVWFWRNITTGEVTLNPPEHLARQEAAPKQSQVLEGTGSLVYDAKMRATYLDFTKIIDPSSTQ